MSAEENISKEIAIPTRIHVKGFDVTIEEDDLLEVFKEFGSIREVKIVREKKTNQSKGYGFITFDSQEVAEKVREEVPVMLVNEQEVTIGQAKIRRGRPQILPLPGAPLPPPPHTLTSPESCCNSFQPLANEMIPFTVPPFTVPPTTVFFPPPPDMGNGWPAPPPYVSVHQECPCIPIPVTIPGNPAAAIPHPGFIPISLACPSSTAIGGPSTIMPEIVHNDFSTNGGQFIMENGPMNHAQTYLNNSVNIQVSMHLDQAATIAGGLNHPIPLVASSNSLAQRRALNGGAVVPEPLNTIQSSPALFSRPQSSPTYCHANNRPIISPKFNATDKKFDFNNVKGAENEHSQSTPPESECESDLNAGLPNFIPPPVTAGYIPNGVGGGYPLLPNAKYEAYPPMLIDRSLHTGQNCTNGINLNGQPMNLTMNFPSGGNRSTPAPHADGTPFSININAFSLNVNGSQNGQQHQVPAVSVNAPPSSNGNGYPLAVPPVYPIITLPTMANPQHMENGVYSDALVTIPGNPLVHDFPPQMPIYNPAMCFPNTASWPTTQNSPINSEMMNGHHVYHQIGGQGSIPFLPNQFTNGYPTNAYVHNNFTSQHAVDTAGIHSYHQTHGSLANPSMVSMSTNQLLEHPPVNRNHHVGVHESMVARHGAPLATVVEATPEEIKANGVLPSAVQQNEQIQFAVKPAMNGHLEHQQDSLIKRNKQKIKIPFVAPDPSTTAAGKETQQPKMTYSQAKKIQIKQRVPTRKFLSSADPRESIDMKSDFTFMTGGPGKVKRILVKQQQHESN